MKISFRAPESVLRVFVHSKQQNQQGATVNAWQDVTNLPSLVSYASSYMESANSMMTTKKPVPEELDRADFSVSKRRVEWTVKNFRGGQNRQLELSLTYKKDVIIDEVQFKQLSPFTVDFDIPNHTASGLRINKMEVKLVQQALGDPNAA